MWPKNSTVRDNLQITPLAGLELGVRFLRALSWQTQMKTHKPVQTNSIRFLRLQVLLPLTQEILRVFQISACRNYGQTHFEPLLLQHLCNRKTLLRTMSFYCFPSQIYLATRKVILMQIQTCADQVGCLLSYKNNLEDQRIQITFSQKEGDVQS